MTSRRLSAVIMTRGSGARLARLAALAREWADEVAIGVDVSDPSDGDATWEIALAHADVAWRFRHAGQLAAARRLPFRFATGEWILSLDDDEILEPGAAEPLREFLADAGRLTHAMLPRRWVTSVDPGRHAAGPPMYPDWQRRLIRNDAGLVWKPPQYHSGYRVLGPADALSRPAILHLEPLLCSEEARRTKFERYRAGSAVAGFEAGYDLDPGRTSLPLPEAAVDRIRQLLDDESPMPSARSARVVPEVQEPIATPRPPWNAEVLEATHPPRGSVGERVFGRTLVRNTGDLHWPIASGNGWPHLQLGIRLLSADGALIDGEAGRGPLPEPVRIGGEVWMDWWIRVPRPAPLEDESPETPSVFSGRLQFDMVSERECWFRTCGSTVLETPFEIVRGCGPSLVPTAEPEPALESGISAALPTPTQSSIQQTAEPAPERTSV
jgi:hypothetical protein